MSTIADVVGCGSCVGCGACEVATDGRVNLKLTSRQVYEATLGGASEDDLRQASEVCPFADESPDEDAVASSLFPTLPTDSRVGRHLAAYAGRIAAGDVTASSSGGLTNWLLTRLLEEGQVDGVVHVGPGQDVLFEYVVSTSVEELGARRKSQYYPINFAGALAQIRGDGKRYAFVGIPCAVKAVRHLTARDDTLREQLAFVVGIVCGHLKSMAYAQSFAWQVGIAPDELAAVDFRVKDPTRTSREYGFRATAHDGRTGEAKTLSLVGGSWGHAVFQLGACDYCDDIFAETADVVLGDAWLARYEIDWRGTNVVMTRRAEIDALFRKGRERGQITLDDLDIGEVAATQGGNFRHRRDGLAVRLADDQAAGQWTPRKRVPPDETVVDAERRSLIRRRRELSRLSHRVFEEALRRRDLRVYLDGIGPSIRDYQEATKMSFRIRLRNKLQREAWKLRGRLSSRGGRR